MKQWFTPSPSTTCWISTRPGWAHYFLLALPLPHSNPTRYKYPTHSFHWHISFTCLWRWNWQWVPKRRQLELRRRGITQKGTNYKIFICCLVPTIFFDWQYKNANSIAFGEYLDGLPQGENTFFTPTKMWPSKGLFLFTYPANCSYWPRGDISSFSHHVIQGTTWL